MLTVDGLCAGYRGLQVLHDVSLEVGEGEIVALLGANGAGKSTTLRAVSGLLRPSAGRVTFDGRDITARRASEVVRSGLVQVPESRDLFGPLTVAENLDMGGYAQNATSRSAALREVYDLFPILAEREKQVAETMSGGQQQMLAIGRALMARPRLLMLDEPSVGLAPKLVGDVLNTVRRIRDHGVTVLIVEQNVAQTLRLCDRAYVMESGSVVLDGSGEAMTEDPRVRRAYLGM